MTRSSEGILVEGGPRIEASLDFEKLEFYVGLGEEVLNKRRVNASRIYEILTEKIEALDSMEPAAKALKERAQTLKERLPYAEVENNLDVAEEGVRIGELANAKPWLDEASASLDRWRTAGLLDARAINELEERINGIEKAIAVGH